MPWPLESHLNILEYLTMKLLHSQYRGHRQHPVLGLQLGGLLWRTLFHFCLWCILFRFDQLLYKKHSQLGFWCISPPLLCKVGQGRCGGRSMMGVLYAVIPGPRFLWEFTHISLARTQSQGHTWSIGMWGQKVSLRRNGNGVWWTPSYSVCAWL